MAGTASESSTDNISAYWKEKFQQHPKYLHQRSNEELYQMYLEDHSGETEVPVNFKQGLSNVKSQLRGKRDKPVKRRVGRPRKDEMVNNGVVAIAGTSMKPVRLRPIAGNARRADR